MDRSLPDTTAGRQVIACRNGETERRSIAVIREKTLTIRLNDREWITLLTDGSEPLELALGHLYNEGLIDGPEQVRASVLNEAGDEARITADLDALPAAGRPLLASGGGRIPAYDRLMAAIKAGQITITGDWRLPLKTLYGFGALLADRSTTYRDTHGVHGAALLNRDEVLCFRDDIGRHNALDKLAGWLLQQRRAAADLAVYTTGRVSSEMMLKMARLGAPIVLSRSMPTATALELAELLGVTLVGRLRRDSCLIFSKPERIELKEEG